jgi:hypothetical protein
MTPIISCYLGLPFPPKYNEISANLRNLRLLFMQNEPNLVRRRRITSAYMRRRYDNITFSSSEKNEPKRSQTYAVWAIWARR